MPEVTAVPIRPIRKGSLIKLWLGLLVLALAAAALAWAGTRPLQVQTLPSGARYRVLAEGHGPAMTPADVAALHYKLHVNSERAPVIQDSEENGQPFVTSVQEVFPGFADALTHMRAGGRYLLWLPSGTHIPAGTPPPGAPFTPRDTLVFEIEMLQIAPGMAAQRQMQMMQQMMQMQQQQQGGAGGGAPPGNSSEAAPPGNSSAGEGRRGR